MKTLGISKLNKIRIKLKNSKPTIGTWQQIPDPSISEILANAGYDWIAIDLEHGAINLNQLPNLFVQLKSQIVSPLLGLVSQLKFHVDSL